MHVPTLPASAFLRNSVLKALTSKMDEVIIKVALLQDEATKRISVDYDKKPGDFKANKAEYRKGRRAYFKSVEKAIAKFVRDEVEEIVKQMNALLPEAQKQANKQAAK